MSDLDDDFDLELDAETLRQIEEEARRKVEAEMLDESVLRDIQAEALADEGVGDVEIDADMMREIEEEARRLLAAEGFDLDDDEEPAPEPEPAPAVPSGPKVAAPIRQASPPEAAALPPKPEPAAGEDVAAPAGAARSSTARRNAVERARQRAEEKARDKTRKKMKQSARVKIKQTHTHRRAISEISAPPEPADNKKMILGVVVAFVVIIGIAIAVGQMTKNPATPQQPAAGAASPGAAPEPTKEELQRQAWDEMQQEIRGIVRQGQTAENLEKAIAELQAFKAENPDYADLCDKDIKRYQGTLSFIKGAGN